ncbi:MAG: DUF4358 domain-containing protein [Oscillospiraceae bacterium]
MTKKIISLILGATLCLSLLAACGTPAADPTATPSAIPSETPSEEPAATPSADPSEEPSAAPTEQPSAPSEQPSAPSEQPAETPAQGGSDLSTSFVNAITSARSEQENTDRPIIAKGGDVNDLYWDTLGFAAADVSDYAFSLSLMNTQAYCVGVFKPVDGKADAVYNGLKAYIDRTIQSFTNYLPDQLVYAENARLEKLADGTVVIVMCENQDTVYDTIVAAL